MRANKSEIAKKDKYKAKNLNYIKCYTFIIKTTILINIL